MVTVHLSYTGSNTKDPVTIPQMQGQYIRTQGAHLILSSCHGSLQEHEVKDNYHLYLLT